MSDNQLTIHDIRKPARLPFLYPTFPASLSQEGSIGNIHSYCTVIQCSLQRDNGTKNNLEDGRNVIALSSSTRPEVKQ